DGIIAFPIAYYMARVAGPRIRAALFMAVLLPLWASYLVRVYAWSVILSENGFLSSVLNLIGLGGLSSVFGVSDVSMTVVFCYLWLPYMILPLYAGLERIPQSEDKPRSEEHTSELQSPDHLVCRLLLE